VRFTDETLFATDSGEGVLDGLVAGDYVCVTYAPHSGAVTALLVLFDPDFPPCGRHLHRTSSDVTDGSPIMSPVLSSASTRFSKDCWRPRS
jgi:hypothetical protein